MSAASSAQELATEAEVTGLVHVMDLIDLGDQRMDRSCRSSSCQVVVVAQLLDDQDLAEEGDLLLAAVLGPIMEEFAQTAPGLRIDVSSLVPESFERLQSGGLDLMLYINVTEGGDLLAQKLYEETYEVLYRQGHPLQEIANSKSDLSPKDLSPFRQIEFNFPGLTELKPDTIMRSDEGQLAPVFHQPFFTTLPFLIGESDAVAAVPKRLGDQIQRVTNLCSSPFRRGESFPYYLVRHERTRHNLAINWFVEQAMASVKRR